MSNYRLPWHEIHEVYDRWPLSERVPQYVQLRGEWEKLHERTGGGEGIKVGVGDTGVDSVHRQSGGDLENVVQVFDVGYGTNDRNGHGTFCTSQIGARNQGGGMIGMAPNVELYHSKVLSDGGSGSSNIIAKGIDKLAEAGCSIISLSLGGGYSDSIERSCRRAREAGILVIASMGNSGNRGDGHPGNSQHTFGSVAIDYNYNLASFSSRSNMATAANFGVQVYGAAPGGRYARMSGTCLKEGEYVYGPNGPTKIEQVQCGDIVYAYEDNKLVERAVSNVLNQGRAETISIHAAGRDVRLTPEHRVLCLTIPSGDIEWVEAQHLRKEKHKMLLPKNFKSQINPYLDRILTKDFCWLLGFFAGDGWISYSRQGMRCSFSEKTPRPLVMQKLQRIYKQMVRKPLKHSKSGKWYYDDCTALAMIIESMGLHCPSDSKNIPLWLWNISIDKQYAFYQGYLDSDGPRKQTGTLNFECKSQSLLRRLSILHDYWGKVRGRLRYRDRTVQAPNSPKPTSGRFYQLSTNKNNVGGGWSEIRASAKHKFSDFFVSTPSIIENVETHQVYDLSIPGANCFVTHGLITHNSMSCPNEAGIWALVQSAELKKYGEIRTKSLDDVLTLVKNSSLMRDLGPNGHDRGYGYGYTEIWNVLDHILTEPDPEPDPPSKGFDPEGSIIHFEKDQKLWGPYKLTKFET